MSNLQQLAECAAWLDTQGDKRAADAVTLILLRDVERQSLTIAKTSDPDLRLAAIHLAANVRIVRTAIPGDWNPGQFAGDAAENALSWGAMGAADGGLYGAAAGAAVGGVGSLAIDSVSNLWYAADSNADKADWQAGAIQDKCDKIANLSGFSQISTLGQHFKDFMDNYVQKKKVDLSGNYFEQNKANNMPVPPESTVTPSPTVVPASNETSTQQSNDAATNGKISIHSAHKFRRVYSQGVQDDWRVQGLSLPILSGLDRMTRQKILNGAFGPTWKERAQQLLIDNAAREVRVQSAGQSLTDEQYMQAVKDKLKSSGIVDSDLILERLQKLNNITPAPTPLTPARMQELSNIEQNRPDIYENLKVKNSPDIVKYEQQLIDNAIRDVRTESAGKPLTGAQYVEAIERKLAGKLVASDTNFNTIVENRLQQSNNGVYSSPTADNINENPKSQSIPDDEKGPGLTPDESRAFWGTKPAKDSKTLMPKQNILDDTNLLDRPGNWIERQKWNLRGESPLNLDSLKSLNWSNIGKGAVKGLKALTIQGAIGAGVDLAYNAASNTAERALAGGTVNLIGEHIYDVRQGVQQILQLTNNDPVVSNACGQLLTVLTDAQNHTSQ